LIAGAALGVAVGILMYGFLGTLAPAIAIASLTFVIPSLVVGAREQAATRERMEAWPDAIAHFRASISAGSTLPDSVISGCHRMGGEFGEFADEVRNQVTFGDGFATALETMRERFDDPVTDRVVATLAVAQSVGGHRVGDVLTSLQRSVADDLRLRRGHDAVMTEQRWTAAVALVAPWALLVLSIATNPQSASAFDTFEGVAVVAIGLAATTFGWFLARRSARLSAPPRVLR
jgi:Flp pilus assembly protein TadB